MRRGRGGSGCPSGNARAERRGRERNRSEIVARPQIAGRAVLGAEVVGEPLEVGAILDAQPEELDAGAGAASLFFGYTNDAAQGDDRRGLGLDVDLEREMPIRTPGDLS